MCAAETFAINYPPLLFAQLIRRRVSAAAATGSCLQLYARLIFCHNFAVFAHIAVKSIETLLLQKDMMLNFYIHYKHKKIGELQQQLVW